MALTPLGEKIERLVTSALRKVPAFTAANKFACISMLCGLLSGILFLSVLEINLGRVPLTLYWLGNEIHGVFPWLLSISIIAAILSFDSGEPWRAVSPIAVVVVVLQEVVAFFYGPFHMPVDYPNF